MLKVGIIAPSGRFAAVEKLTEVPDSLKQRLKKNDNKTEFVLVFAEESATGFDIVISQGDIREIQLVKSSICTGIQVLMGNYGITFKEVEEVLIAGAFGNYIDIESAQVLGLLPRAKSVRPIGNAAGTGSAKALLSGKYMDRCGSIAKRAQFVELANDPGFQKRFLKNLAFTEVTQ